MSIKAVQGAATGHSLQKSIVLHSTGGLKCYERQILTRIGAGTKSITITHCVPSRHNRKQSRLLVTSAVPVPAASAVISSPVVVERTGGAIGFDGATEPLGPISAGGGKRIVLLRHGLSAWNEEGRVQVGMLYCTLRWNQCDKGTTHISDCRGMKRMVVWNTLKVRRNLSAAKCSQMYS